MDADLDKQPPLKDRIAHLGSNLTSLSRAINEELDWRDKLESVPDDDLEEN